MTIEDIQKLEQELGREATNADIRAEVDRRNKEIKAYANKTLYTDVEPYEVVRIVSENCVEVREMDTEQTQSPQHFTPGGFVGHFADNRGGQKYKYISNPENPVFKIRWSRANRRWQKNGMKFHMADEPYKFYDYNF